MTEFSKTWSLIPVQPSDVAARLGQVYCTVPRVSPGWMLNDTPFNTSGSPFLYRRETFLNLMPPLLGQSDGGFDRTLCFPSHSSLYKQVRHSTAQTLISYVA